jgi:hypothetical protein
LPKDAGVYIDSKLIRKTAMFSNSALLENILPKKYEFKISKEGYYSWQKTLEVKESRVTEAKYVVLFPLEVELQEVAAETEKAEILLKMNLKEEKEMPKNLADFIFNDFAVSSDNKKIAFYTDNEIRIFFTENHYDLWKSAGDIAFLTRFSEKINQVFWLDDYHLLLSVGESVKITEIDERDKPNIVNLLELKNPKLYWDKNNKTAYILSQDVLYKISNLLP